MKNYSCDNTDSKVQQHQFLSEELLVPRKDNLDVQRSTPQWFGPMFINLEPLSEPINVYSNEYRHSSTSEIN